MIGPHFTSVRLSAGNFSTTPSLEMMWKNVTGLTGRFTMHHLPTYWFSKMGWLTRRESNMAEKYFIDG
jgi:hypothetical protein